MTLRRIASPTTLSVCNFTNRCTRPARRATSEPEVATDPGGGRHERRLLGKGQRKAVWPNGGYTHAEAKATGAEMTEELPKRARAVEPRTEENMGC